MRFPIRALALLAAAAIPALAQEVRTDYDRRVDFSKYHTFCVDRVHTAEPFMETRLRDSLNFRLTKNGMTNVLGVVKTRTDQGPAPVQIPATCDIAVRAVGVVHNQQEYTTFYNGFGPGWGYGGWGGGFGGWGGPWGGWGGGPAVTRVEQIPINSLVVDVYDTHTKQLIFRGVSSADLSKHSDTNTRRLNIAVDKMFKKFPPKIKGQG
jgi:Domain of unknown function (DUF4136)